MVDKTQDVEYGHTDIARQFCQHEVVTERGRWRCQLGNCLRHTQLIDFNCQRPANLESPKTQAPLFLHKMREEDGHRKHLAQPGGNGRTDHTHVHREDEQPVQKDICPCTHAYPRKRQSRGAVIPHENRQAGAHQHEDGKSAAIEQVVHGHVPHGCAESAPAAHVDDLAAKYHNAVSSIHTSSVRATEVIKAWFASSLSLRSMRIATTLLRL